MKKLVGIFPLNLATYNVEDRFDYIKNKLPKYNSFIEMFKINFEIEIQKSNIKCDIIFLENGFIGVDWNEFLKLNTIKENKVVKKIFIHYISMFCGITFISIEKIFDNFVEFVLDERNKFIDRCSEMFKNYGSSFGQTYLLKTITYDWGKYSSINPRRDPVASMGNESRNISDKEEYKNEILFNISEHNKKHNKNSFVHVYKAYFFGSLITRQHHLSMLYQYFILEELTNYYIKTVGINKKLSLYEKLELIFKNIKDKSLEEKIQNIRKTHRNDFIHQKYEKENFFDEVWKYQEDLNHLESFEKKINKYLKDNNY